MKKHTLRLLSAILSVTTLMSTFGSVTSFATEISDSNDKQQQATNTQDYRATGDLTLEEGEIPKDVTIIDSASEYYKIRKKNLPNSGQLLLNSSGTLPKSVDNSDSEYFPAIGNQGSIGSCVCWAQSYYQYTYTYNKAMNIKTTPDNSFSPKWTYNLVSGGDAGKGSVNTDVYNIMKKSEMYPTKQYLMITMLHHGALQKKSGERHSATESKITRFSKTSAQKKNKSLPLMTRIFLQ